MKKGFTLVELLTGSFIVFVILSIFIAPFVHYSSTGRGSHTGYITAIEQEGILFPNYRIYVKTDNSSSQEDKYCLNRNKEYLASFASQMSKKRQLVNIEFNGVRGIGLGLCDDIEIINITVDENK